MVGGFDLPDLGRAFGAFFAGNGFGTFAAPSEPCCPPAVGASPAVPQTRVRSAQMNSRTARPARGLRGDPNTVRLKGRCIYQARNCPEQGAANKSSIASDRVAASRGRRRHRCRENSPAALLRFFYTLQPAETAEKAQQSGFKKSLNQQCCTHMLPFFTHCTL